MFIKLSEYYYTNKFIPISTDSTVLKVAKISGLIFLGPIIFLFDYALKLLANRNITQKKDSDLLSLVESKLGNAEKAQDRLSAVEETFTKIDDQKYILSFVAQKKTLETCLKDFKIDSKDFLIPIYKHLAKVAERLLKEYSNSELPNDYKEYTCILRDAINTKECKKNKCALIIQELCFTKFVYTVLTDLEEKIIKTTIGFDSSRNMTSSNISKLIEEDNNNLHKQCKTVRQSISLNYEKACNAAGINSDQLSQANIPELRSIHTVKQGAESYNVYYIRYPTPTIETTKSFLARVIGKNATATASEFIGFLDSIRKKNPFSICKPPTHG